MIRVMTGLFREERALAAAWRWFLRNPAPEIPLSEFIDQVTRRCPDADTAYARRYLEERLRRSRWKGPRA